MPGGSLFLSKYLLDIEVIYETPYSVLRWLVLPWVYTSSTYDISLQMTHDTCSEFQWLMGLKCFASWTAISRKRNSSSRVIHGTLLIMVVSYSESFQLSLLPHSVPVPAMGQSSWLPKQDLAQYLPPVSCTLWIIQSILPLSVCTDGDFLRSVSYYEIYYQGKGCAER